MNKVYFSIITTLIIFISNVQLKAQNNSNIGIGAEIGFPSGNFSNLSAIGTGVSIKTDLSIAGHFVATLNAGIMNFFGRHNQLLNIQDFTYVPLKGGLKYRFTESFYAEGQLGGAIPLNDGQKTLFVWSPGVGNLFNLRNKNKIDLGIRYEAWTGKSNSSVVLNSSSSNGFAGIRFAYVFGL